MSAPSENLINQLKRHEGFYRRPYLCTANACTIGYGANLEAHPKYIADVNLRRTVEAGLLKGKALRDRLRQQGMEWDEAMADAAMREELASCEAELARSCPQYVKLRGKAEIARAEVLWNMAFNMGVPRLLTFRNTLAMLDQAIDGLRTYGDVARGMLNSRWARQVKGRARELAAQMEKGFYA